MEEGKVLGVTVTEYVDVRTRASALGLGLSSQLAILPRNFESAASDTELLHEADAATVRKLLHAAGLQVQQLEPSGKHLRSVVQKSADWISPTLFIGSMLLSENQYAIQVALGVLDSYIADFLKGRLFEGKVKLCVVVERTKTKTCHHITYEGPPSGLKSIESIIRKLQDE